MRYLVIVFSFSGCASSTYSTKKEFNGLKSIGDEKLLAHVNTKKLGVHVLFGWIPLLGVNTIPNTVNALTKDAKKAGADSFEIVHSSRTNWWGVFPPFTFILTPVTVEVAANVYGIEDDRDDSSKAVTVIDRQS